ncbi:unnamed protein product [Cryptosporidium hominis]|uniref:Uncharacterized protein n=2 Tax=Cryptosporidium hominis TaxID=237895 RepID=A0A0S4TLE7_CRYHO|nr:hypothetical protein ChTU502y2012_421g0080 [Cryptosporidium hominis]PPA63332.1 hypothetical protein ChUKH1_09885 [Cryptosporidium hominis]PPS98195.1 Uncharacterized protein GY17_00000621 [Cryptosporidium hominis]CUV07737.1 unnamed protein product [Cryptosporidium hominis]|eukprot:PPS98195.1 Uncharacterized protein GY17_00000621 [Cryptosporidium hominis]
MIIEKTKRKSEVRDFGTPGKNTNEKKYESNELRTSLILNSKTRSIEKPAPKPICMNNVSENGHTGVGRVIKYLNERDACMQNDVSRTMQTCELPVKHANEVCGLIKLIRIIFSIFTYSVFILFILLTILSLNTLFENKYSKLVEISELITSVTIPSVEDIYYFSKESKESVREAFRYLSGNKDADSLFVKQNNKKKERKKSSKLLSELPKNQNKVNSSEFGFYNQSFFDLSYDRLSIEHYDSSSASADANYEISWRREFIKDQNKNLNDNLKFINEIQGKNLPKSSSFGYRKNEQEQKQELESVNNHSNLTKLVEIILGQSQLKKYFKGKSVSILELLCYQNFSFQEGILSMYYKENDHGIPFNEYFLESDQNIHKELIKKLLNRTILDLLGIERNYELYIIPTINYHYDNQLQVNTNDNKKSIIQNHFRVSRRVIVSSGYGNEEIRDFCEYQNNWICTKYEMLVLKLLQEYYKGNGETFISYFLFQYKNNIVDKNLLDNIPFFTKDQIIVINDVFPGLFTSFQNLTNSIYKKIDDFEKNKKRNNNQSKYYFEKVTQEDINWIISLVLSHSLQDKDGHIAFVPYFNIIPHNSVKVGGISNKVQTLIHHPNELSFDWSFSKSFDYEYDKHSENIKKDDFTMIYSFYGHLNNIKSVVQYGKLLYKNEYSTVWFIRKDEKDTYKFKILFGTNTILNNMNNNYSAYKDNLPNWLINLTESNHHNSKIRINMNTQFVHYISNKKKIPIQKNKKELEMKYIDCNEYTFYNGMGLGFGTIQFTRSSYVGGINGTVYVCLREIMFRNYQQNSKKNGILFNSSNNNEGINITNEKKEEILANIIQSNCVKRSTQLKGVKNLLMHQLGMKLGKEEDLINLSSKIKQEIRINIKLLYGTMEELASMKKCVSYFGNLISMISKEKI